MSHLPKGIWSFLPWVESLTENPFDLVSPGQFQEVLTLSAITIFQEAVFGKILWKKTFVIYSEHWRTP